jgi:MerR HTH family regulatory protein
VNIFELARSAGVTPSVVRFYARSGAFPGPHPQPDGRLGYDERDAARLRLAVTLHRLGAGAVGRIGALDPFPAPDPPGGMPGPGAEPDPPVARDTAPDRMPTRDRGR